MWATDSIKSAFPHLCLSFIIKLVIFGGFTRKVFASIRAAYLRKHIYFHALNLILDIFSYGNGGVEISYCSYFYIIFVIFNLLSSLFWDYPC